MFLKKALCENNVRIYENRLLNLKKNDILAGYN